AAGRQRLPLMFYSLATLLMYLLCFGPQPHFLGVPFMYEAPYGWLMNLPGYDTVRVPARFAMLAALCLAASAGLGFARLTSLTRGGFRAGFAAVVAGGGRGGRGGWGGGGARSSAPPRAAAH